MRPSRVVVDTGSGYNVIRKDALLRNWRQRVLVNADLPDLCDANGNPLNIRHEVQLRIRLGDAVYPVRFLIVTKLACSVLLGTQFLDKHVDAIKCRQRVVYLTRSIVPILGVWDSRTPYQGEYPVPEPVPEEPTTPTKETRAPKKPLVATCIRLCRPVRLPAYAQVKAQVITPGGGLVYIEPVQAVYQRYQVRAINGVHEVHPDIPFELLISNFSNVKRRLPKGMLIAYATPSPLALVALLGDGAREMASLLNITPLEETPPCETTVTQKDLARAAPDPKEAPTWEPGASEEVGPPTTETAPPPPPTGRGSSS